MRDTLGDLAGRVIAGRYRLRSRVGRGGMGVVWRARDEVLARDVAVKEVVSPPELGEAEQQVINRRAVREARSAARLSHPGVVTVYDVVEEDGRPWVIMELVRARSLQEVLAEEGPMPPWRVARIGRQMLSALGAAHAVGILHRDVKPSNVLLTSRDQAILTDFGIAIMVGDAALTQTGAVLGSPAYTAPERIRGELATPASDLWALGVTLYDAVEGQPPFQRTDPVAVFGAVLVDEPAVPRRAGPLRPVIEGLLNKDPRLRMSAGVAEAVLIAVAGEGPAPGPAQWSRPAQTAAFPRTLTAPASTPASSPASAPAPGPAPEPAPGPASVPARGPASVPARGPASVPAPGPLPVPMRTVADLPVEAVPPPSRVPPPQVPPPGPPPPSVAGREDAARPAPAPGPAVPAGPQPFARLAGLFAYTAGGLLAAAALLALLGSAYPGSELAERGWPYVLGTIGMLALLSIAHVVVALGLYLAGDRRPADRITVAAGVLGSVALLALLISVPGLVGTDREPSGLLGLLWGVTGGWLGMTGALGAVRSRPVALAGEAAAGLWILLIIAPTMSRGALAGALAGTVLVYGVWAVGVGRTLRGQTS